MEMHLQDLHHVTNKRLCKYEKIQSLDQLAHSLTHIMVFSFPKQNLLYPEFVKTNNKCSDQTSKPGLIWQLFFCFCIQYGPFTCGTAHSMLSLSETNTSASRTFIQCHEKRYHLGIQSTPIYLEVLGTL